MAERGNYAKGLAKRDEILEVALRLVADKGYTNATLREIADKVSLTKNGLLHHFGSKEELFAEVLRRRDELDRARTAEGGVEEGFESLAETVAHTAQVAGLVRLYVRFSAEATDPGHTARAYFSERYRQLREEFTRGFEELRVSGHLRDDVDSEVCATQLIALLDGLQTQWLYDPRLDMSAHVLRFLELVTTAVSAPTR